MEGSTGSLDGGAHAPTWDSRDRAGSLDPTGCVDVSPLSTQRLMARLPTEQRTKGRAETGESQLAPE